MTRTPSLGRVYTVFVVAFAGLCGAVSLIYPFGRDQGTYGYAGWVLLEGGVPYRDVLVVKPPMTVLVHGAAMGLFGVNTWAIRVFDIGWTASTAIAVAAVALELWGRRDAALGAGLAVPLLYYQVDYWNIAQTDGWMVLPSTVAVLAVLRGGRFVRENPRRAFAYWTLAGGLAGVAVLFKYTAGTMVLPMLVALAFMAATQGRRAWMGLAAMLAGGLLALGSCWLWLAATDAWTAFLDIQRDMVAPYTQRRSGAETPGAVLSKLLRLRGARVDLLPLCLAAPLTIVPAMIAAKGDGKAGWWGLGVASTWWLAAVANVAVQGKFFDYHYLPIAAPAALIAGYGLDVAFRAVLPGTRRPAARTAALISILALLMATTPIGARARDLARVATGAQSIDDYIASRREYSLPSYSVEEVRQVADLARDMTDPTQRVFVWSFEATINVRAQRHTVSRFSSNRPFFPHLRAPALDAELMSALRANPPDLFIVGSRDRVLGPVGTYADSATLFRSFAELRSFVEERYEFLDEVGRYAVWQHRESASHSD